MPSPEADSSTLNEDSSTSASNTGGTSPNASDLTNPQESNARTPLQQITRRHSLPASYHLSNFFSFFSQNGAGASVNEPSTSSKSPQRANPNHPQNNSSATPSDRPAPPAPPSSINRHRYGHRHTKSAALDQPVVVRTYNPPATTRASTRAGIMNPAIYEEEEAQRVELPPVEAFSLDGILKAINPEGLLCFSDLKPIGIVLTTYGQTVTKTLDKVSYLCLRLREDVRAEVEVTAQNQKEIYAQKQQAEKLAAQALKTTNTRCDSLTADTSGLKGGKTSFILAMRVGPIVVLKRHQYLGAAVEDLAQLTERTYTTLHSILSTLLAIDELLPPQERLAPEYSAHQAHYPRLHELLNKKYTEINVRFGTSTVARSNSGGQPIPTTSRQNPFISATVSPPSSPTQLSASLPNPTHQEPGWLRRRMSSSSTMLLSSQSNTASDQDPSSRVKRLSLPPHLQLRTILPTPSYGHSPPRNTNSSSKRATTAGFSSMSSELSRRKSTNALSLGSGERRYTSLNASGPSVGGSRSGWDFHRSSNGSSGGLFNGSWKDTGKWGFFGSRGSSTESEKRLSAEEKLRRVLNASNVKGKSVDRSGQH